MATRYDIVREGAVASTQDVAVETFGRTGHETLVVAESQVAGRGRQGRTWVEPDRGMYSSFVTRTSWPIERRTLIPLTVAVALRRAIQDVAGISVETKWPNDVLVEGRKVGGILVEASDERIAIGCGVNLWWREPPSFASALFDTDPGNETVFELAVRWVDVFVELHEANHRDWPRDEYEDSCLTLGSSVEWDGGTGVAAGIAAHGGLVVDTPDGPVTLDHGDVHLTRQG